jgi:hypothetical protein
MKKLLLLMMTSFLIAGNVLAETIVIPSVVHSPGANGSFWKTAMGIYNASNSVQTISAKSISSTGSTPTGELQPGQYIGVEDLGVMFDEGEGTFLVALTRSDPNVLFTARTYSVTEGQEGQFSTLLPPVTPIIDPIKIVFSRIEGARKALFLYGNLKTSCITTEVNAIYFYYGTPGSLVRLPLPNETLTCTIENLGSVGYPSGGEPTDYFYYGWASEADDISNCPTIIVAE